MDLWEDLRLGSKIFQLTIETIEEENCTNSTIEFSYLHSSSNINISIQDILTPADCSPGQAPAKSTVDIGNLAPGFYELDIDLKNTIFNKGQLTVTDSRFTIDMNSDDGISFLRRELLRIPNQTIWGYIGFHNSSDAIIALNFTQELEAISSTRSLEKGYYGHFNINSDGKLNMEHPFDANQSRTFFHEFNGEDTALQNLVDTYRTDYGDAIEIKLFNSEGKEF